jgi:hypothetical protein
MYVISKQEAGRICPPQGDSTCYCISTGTCYPIRQTVDIDNCNLDRYLSNPLQIQYTVTSQSGNNATGLIAVSIHFCAFLSAVIKVEANGSLLK